MTTGEIIIKKLQQLLAMTKDSLVADVEREFGWIRTAFLEGAEATNNAKTRKDQFEQIEKMVDAIFTQLGYDLSQYENISALRETVNGFLSIADKMDNLASSYNDASNKGFDEESTATFLLNAGGVAQDILGFYKDLKNIEISRIEMDDAVDSAVSSAKEVVFKLETLHRLFDHIIIALLKNAKVVFKDEIDYLENLVSQTKTTVTATVESLEKQLRNELGIAEKEMKVLMGDALSDLRKVESNVKEQLKEFKEDLLIPDNREVLLKFYRTINSIYAVLDFLGIIGDAEIEIKIPKKIQDAYKDIHSVFAQTVSDIKSATKYVDSNIKRNNETNTLVIVQKKTKALNAVPIGNTALSWMPPKGDDDFVFHLPAKANVDAALKRIAKKVGIEKNISFHCSRHTFGILVQAVTGNIETTKKLMGHKSLKSTAIYADVLTNEKVKAVDNTKKAFRGRKQREENKQIPRTKRTAATNTHPRRITFLQDNK